jgi:hypothetical protein
MDKKRLQELAGLGGADTTVPNDVKNLSKAIDTSPTIQSRSKNINTTAEFPGAFEKWFTSLGFDSKKISKTFVKSQVDAIMTKLGYK